MSVKKMLLMVGSAKREADISVAPTALKKLFLDDGDYLICIC